MSVRRESDGNAMAEALRDLPPGGPAALAEAADALAEARDLLRSLDANIAVLPRTVRSRIAGAIARCDWAARRCRAAGA